MSGSDLLLGDPSLIVELLRRLIYYTHSVLIGIKKYDRQFLPCYRFHSGIMCPRGFGIRISHAWRLPDCGLPQPQKQTMTRLGLHFRKYQNQNERTNRRSKRRKKHLSGKRCIIFFCQALPALSQHWLGL